MKSLNRYHRKLVEWLEELGFLCMEEYPVGKRSLDIYLSEMHLGVEVDGPQHNRVKDFARDAEILAESGINIIHIKVGTRKDDATDVVLGYAFEHLLELEAELEAKKVDQKRR